MILHPEGHTVTRFVEVIEDNLSFDLQSGFIRNRVGEVKGQQLGNVAPWICRILPEWVWLGFYSLGSGSVLTNLERERERERGAGGGG